MSLLLVQHGKSLSKEVDPEQGLSDDGRTETEEIASAAEARRSPDRSYSPKREGKGCTDGRNFCLKVASLWRSTDDGWFESAR